MDWNGVIDVECDNFYYQTFVRRESKCVMRVSVCKGLMLRCMLIVKDNRGVESSGSVSRSCRESDYWIGHDRLVSVPCISSAPSL
jgi:hypothetical protein